MSACPECPAHLDPCLSLTYRDERVLFGFSDELLLKRLGCRQGDWNEARYVRRFVQIYREMRIIAVVGDRHTAFRLCPQSAVGEGTNVTSVNVSQ